MKNYNELIESNITMVLPHCFDMILKHKTNISKLSGDIIECGVWRGGFSIFLAKTFPKKKIWVSDSFQGFQPLKTAIFSYNGERHQPNYDLTVSLDTVKENFKQYEIPETRVEFLPGFVKDTLPNCDISKISVLRIDVDAFSATLEVLTELYDKVVPGGYIIFDDSCLYETVDAIKTFFKERNIDPYIKHPITDDSLYVDINSPSKDGMFPSGCYIIK